jgi:flagellar motor protein MotB
MKKYFIIISLFTVTFPLASQEIYMEGGQTISNFTFEDSNGNLLENLQPVSNAYMKLGYRSRLFTENLFFSALASYNRYGSEGSDRSVDNYFTWDLNHLGINTGVDYAFYHPGDFTFLIKGEGSAEFMVRGTQTLNNQVYKLKGEEQFDSPLFMLRPGLGVQYKISEKVAAFCQYHYSWGGPFKSSNEKLRIYAHNAGVGVLIDLFASTSPAHSFESAQTVQMRQDLKQTLNRVNELEKEAVKVKELEKEIATKDKQMQSLKDTLSTVLFNVSEKELNVELRDGKIYITLENDMLFQPGRWDLGVEGKSAVNALAGVLAQNQDVNILIEGHTDNQPYQGRGNIQNNWDLSAKRAAAIVEMLTQHDQIRPENLTAAGRGEYAPVASNATTQGRAKNRRIEVIISPRLDQVFKILNH